MILGSKLSISNAIGFSLLIFGLIGFLGVLMRLAFSTELPEIFNFVNMRKAHTYGAMMGWLSVAFLLLILYFFNIKWSEFQLIISAFFMGIFLTIGAYLFDANSNAGIVCSSITFLILYYIFFQVWRKISQLGGVGMAVLFLKTAIIFFVIATLGIWAVFPIQASGMKGSALYYGSVQFYLHFIFNGFYLFSLLSIVLKWCEKLEIQLPKPTLKQLYFYLIISTVLTFALAVTWSTPYFAIFLINSLGVLLQLIALYFVWKLKPYLKAILKSLSNTGKILLKFTFISFVLKIIIQTLVVFPFLAEISYGIRNFVIAFIHLNMLGVYSTFILACISYLYPLSISKMGSWIFLAGIVFTELILFIDGVFLWQKMGQIPQYYNFLSVFSMILFAGILILIIQYFRNIFFQNRFTNS